MAAKRITQVNINWVAFLERAPPAQNAQALAFKSRVDNYTRKLAALPEKPPAIDWAFYKSRVTIPGMVENFQKKYESLSIPFPTDTLTAKIEQDKQNRIKEAASYVEELNGKIKEVTSELEAYRSALPFSEMTMEDFQEAYPDLAINTFSRPSHWPHQEEDMQDAIYYAQTGQIPEDARIPPKDYHPNED